MMSIGRPGGASAGSKVHNNPVRERAFHETMKMLNRFLDTHGRVQSDGVAPVRKLFMDVLTRQSSKDGKSTDKALRAMSERVLVFIRSSVDPVGKAALANMLRALDTDKTTYSRANGKDKVTFEGRILTGDQQAELDRLFPPIAYVNPSGGVVDLDNIPMAAVAGRRGGAGASAVATPVPQGRHVGPPPGDEVDASPLPQVDFAAHINQSMQVLKNINQDTRIVGRQKTQAKIQELENLRFAVNNEAQLYRLLSAEQRKQPALFYGVGQWMNELKNSLPTSASAALGAQFQGSASLYPSSAGANPDPLASFRRIGMDFGGGGGDSPAVAYPSATAAPTASYPDPRTRAVFHTVADFRAKPLAYSQYDTRSNNVTYHRLTAFAQDVALQANQTGVTPILVLAGNPDRPGGNATNVDNGNQFAPRSAAGGGQEENLVWANNAAAGKPLLQQALVAAYTTSRRAIVANQLQPGDTCPGHYRSAVVLNGTFELGTTAGNAKARIVSVSGPNIATPTNRRMDNHYDQTADYQRPRLTPQQVATAKQAFSAKLTESYTAALEAALVAHGRSSDQLVVVLPLLSSGIYGGANKVESSSLSHAALTAALQTQTVSGQPLGHYFDQVILAQK